MVVRVEGNLQDPALVEQLDVVTWVRDMSIGYAFRSGRSTASYVAAHSYLVISPNRYVVAIKVDRPDIRLLLRSSTDRFEVEDFLPFTLSVNILPSRGANKGSR
jgi:hypothetical protein